MALLVSKVRSLGEFTAKILEIRQDWSLPENKELWFRGEKLDYGTTRLRPALYRPPIGRSLKPISDLLRIEDALFEAFQRSNGQLTDTLIEDDFDGYLLMQHHGGPTRLLDWSDGSLMALHFALRNKGAREEDSCVYVLDQSRLMETLDAQPDTKVFDKQWAEHRASHPHDDEDDSHELYLPSPDGSQRPFELPRTPIVLTFPLFSRRVAAQRSQFLVFGSDPSWLSTEADRHDSSIRTIIIDGKQARSIRAELRECGVTESVIFPDLDGLGRELNQLWEDRR